MRKAWLTVPIFVYLFAAVVSSAFAQDPKWELEGYAGLSFTEGSRHGMAALPPPGAAFTTVNGFPSRRVSSWMFGDGALLLDQVSRQFFLRPPAPRTVLLDLILQGPLIEPRNGAAFGVRFGRRLSSRLIGEVTIDRLPGVEPPTNAAGRYIAAGRAIEGFETFLNMGPLRGSTDVDARPVTATQRRLLLTGAANFEFATSERLRPYVAGGAGIMKRTGTSPTASLVGSIEYEHISIPFNTVQELDQVELTGTTKKTRPVGVVGGGVRIPLSERIGLRADARVHFSANRDETFVSATPPTRTAGGTAGYYEVGIDPSIQIQTSSQLPDSEVSFSGPPISNFRTFQGTGIETNINVTFGAFWRF